MTSREERRLLDMANAFDPVEGDLPAEQWRMIRNTIYSVLRESASIAKPEGKDNAAGQVSNEASAGKVDAPGSQSAPAPAAPLNAAPQDVAMTAGNKSREANAVPAVAAPRDVLPPCTCVTDSEIGLCYKQCDRDDSISWGEAPTLEEMRLVGLALDNPELRWTHAQQAAFAKVHSQLERELRLSEAQKAHIAGEAANAERNLYEAISRERLANMRADQAEEARDAALELLRDVADSGVSYDAGKYVEIQIAKGTFNEIRGLASEAGK